MVVTVSPPAVSMQLASVETESTGVFPPVSQSCDEVETAPVFATSSPLLAADQKASPWSPAVLSMKVELEMRRTANEPFAPPPPRDALLRTKVEFSIVEATAWRPTTTAPAPSTDELSTNVLP